MVQKPRAAAKPFQAPVQREPRVRTLASATTQVIHMRSLMQRHETTKRRRDSRVAKLEAEIANIKATEGARLKAIEAKLERKGRTVYAYLEKHRETLTPGDTKTIKFQLDAYGSWREDSYVDIKDEDKLFAELKKLKLTDCYEIEYSFTKDAIRKRLESGTILSNASVEKRERFSFKFDGIETSLASEVSDDPSSWKIKEPTANRKKAA